jgi:hypothetical protein
MVKAGGFEVLRCNFLLLFSLESSFLPLGGILAYPFTSRGAVSNTTQQTQG